MEYEYESEHSPYLSVKKFKQRNLDKIEDLKDQGYELAPLEVNHRTKIAKTFWGQEWCKNIETYKDMEQRLERGRRILRNFGVFDLKMINLSVEALVHTDHLYEVHVEFAKVTDSKWNEFLKSSSSQNHSILELLQGKLSKDLKTLICSKDSGLFPQLSEIKLKCSCLDDAECCEHIAATLYGLGVLFDHEARLFFKLRGRDPGDLIKQTSQNLQSANSSLDSSSIEDLFDIECSDPFF